MYKNRAYISFLTLLLTVFFVGCASFGERNLKIRSDFDNGQLEHAKKQIETQLQKSRAKDADVLKLNQALIELCTGKPKNAERILREVRDNFDRIEREQLTKKAEKTVSMLTDDNTVSYAGEDYEKVLIRVFLSLANLMHDGTDAAAYALQVNQKQNEIIENGKLKNPKDGKEVNSKLSYKQVSAGAYLYGLLREETRLNNDDAVRAYLSVCQWNPQFQQGKNDLQRAMHGIHSAPGNGVVYVFCLAGSGPYKVQENSEVTQAALFLTSFLLSILGNHSVTPGIAPVLIPVVAHSPYPVPVIQVEINGRDAGITETLTDIRRMAEEQFEAIKAEVIARAVVRRAVKKGILYGAKEAMNADPWISLALDVAGIIWEANEKADTRCWNLLPAEIQVLRIELPAGVHRLRLSLLNNRRSYKDSSTIFRQQEVRVDAGRNTYVLACCPNSGFAGEVVVSER
ncbi:MAG: hypothetical protein FWE67_07355 [Planctomycetaceae bacterium]|nr:hypothetical protein [Planctomycetaceae bacterium]